MVVNRLLPDVNTYCQTAVLSPHQQSSPLRGPSTSAPNRQLAFFQAFKTKGIGLLCSTLFLRRRAIGQQAAGGFNISALGHRFPDIHQQPWQMCLTIPLPLCPLPLWFPLEAIILFPTYTGRPSCPFSRHFDLPTSHALPSFPATPSDALASPTGKQAHPPSISCLQDKIRHKT